MFRKTAKTLIDLIACVLILAVIAFSAFSVPDIPLEELRKKYATPPSQFINIQDMHVHYRDEGRGMPLVLLHGTAASLHTWDGWSTHLKDSLRVIRMDLPAFGLTGPHPDRDYSIEAYVDFVVYFLDALKIDTFYLAGNSLGGRIAWHIAIAHPKRVQKLILVDASGFPVPPTKLFRLARTPGMNYLLKHITPRKLVRENLLEVYSDTAKVSPALIDRYWEMARRPGNRDAFVDRVRTAHTDQTEALKQIECPTLILWGQHDTWTPVRHAHQFYEYIPNAHLRIYPNAGHVPMEELPERSALDARNFVLNAAQ